MTRFQQVLWGYELQYPEDWVHTAHGGTEAFSPLVDTLVPGQISPSSGQLLISAEWNWSRTPVEPLWQRHLAMTAGMIGARKVGSAPWHMAGGAGMEAEILLPKREEKRLWAGILLYRFIVLKFAVVHPLKDRDWFEPQATEMIKSLKFLNRVLGLETTKEGIPLPPGYTPVPPAEVIPDIEDPASWRAFDGAGAVGGLQAFYLREAPVYNWEIEEYVPFPGADIGFARFRMRQGQKTVILGLMPFGDVSDPSANRGKLVIKFG